MSCVYTYKTYLHHNIILYTYAACEAACTCTGYPWAAKLDTNKY